MSRTCYKTCCINVDVRRVLSIALGSISESTDAYTVHLLLQQQRLTGLEVMQNQFVVISTPFDKRPVLVLHFFATGFKLSTRTKE